jgi:hypothetical protein
MPVSFCHSFMQMTPHSWSNPTTFDLYRIANEQMYKAEAWFLDNRLHPSKTRYMLFSHREPQNSKLELLGQQIERVSETSREKSFKLVGIHLDDKMSLKYRPKYHKPLL